MDIIPPVEPDIEVISIGRRDRRTDDWLIRGVSLSVKLGDRLGIVGPSGAGKTVLLRAMAMLDPLDAGTIHWRGRPVNGDAVPAYRRQVLYLHQKSALFDGSVEDNLQYPYTLGEHRFHRFNRGRATDLLASLGRDTAFLEKTSRDLSGGEAQIVAFVRALQLDPAVLLLDEPTASLDPITARALEAQLEEWLAARASERALVWVSHDREQALRMTSRRLFLSGGRLETEG